MSAMDENVSGTINTFSGSKPGSTLLSRTKLLKSRPAPTRMLKANAISLTTNAPLVRMRPLPADDLPVDSFSDSLTSVRAA